MTEFIGSRISLISKRDIRYVGTLHEINSENSTVALEQVVSYGTEGRRTDDEVPPSLDNVYEYIVFRGSDVKDLRIEEGPKDGNSKPNVPDDPAILGSTRKTASGQGQQQSNQNAPPRQQPGGGGIGPGPQQQQPQIQQHQQHGSGGFPPQNVPYGFNPNQRFNGPNPHGFPPGPYPFPPGPYNVPPGWYPPPGYPQMGPGHFPPQQMPPGPAGQRGPMGPPQGPGVPTPSGSTAPSDEPQPFPKPEEKGVAAVKLPGASGTPIPIQEAPSSASPGGVMPEGKAEAVQGKPPVGVKGNRIVPAVPLAKGATPTNGANLNKSVEDANREARAAVAAAMAKLPAGQGQKTQADDGMDNLSKRVSEMRTNDIARGSRGGQPGNYRGRGPRGAGRGQGPHQGQKIEIPTTDYDFDAANAKFNKQDLVKEAIASGSPITTPNEETGGDAFLSNSMTARKSSDSGLGSAGPSYNKSTSFFDDISSEIKDRAESHEPGARRGGREFRNEERQKNMETFGQGSVDNNHRYRGRGRGRGRGGYSRGRGGPRGGRGRGVATTADA